MSVSTSPASMLCDDTVIEAVTTSGSRPDRRDGVLHEAEDRVVGEAVVGEGQDPRAVGLGVLLGDTHARGGHLGDDGDMSAAVGGALDGRTPHDEVAVLRGSVSVAHRREPHRGGRGEDVGRDRDVPGARHAVLDVVEALRELFGLPLASGVDPTHVVVLGRLVEEVRAVEVDVHTVPRATREHDLAPGCSRGRGGDHELGDEQGDEQAQVGEGTKSPTTVLVGQNVNHGHTSSSEFKRVRIWTIGRGGDRR